MVKMILRETPWCELRRGTGRQATEMIYTSPDNVDWRASTIDDNVAEQASTTDALTDSPTLTVEGKLEEMMDYGVYVSMISG